jgi:hypothetical protein
MTATRAHGTAGRLTALVVFAAAMGWLEAVVVVYIRGLLGFRDSPLPPGPEEMMRRLMASPWIIPTEQTREAATIVMLVTVAWIAGRSARSRFGAFLVAFGVWDIVYYIGLYALIHWPTSLTTMDLLFLIPPHPWWYQPVWVPVAMSCLMIAVGFALQRERRTQR